MKKPLPLSLRLLPVLVVMGVIFYLSHQPANELDLPEVPYLDKVAHFLIYGALAAAAVFVPTENFKKARPGITAVAVVFFAALYGLGDEFHQSYIPGRDVSLGDVIADAGGALSVSLLWLKRISPNIS